MVTLIVVEDDHDIRDALRQALEEEGYAVATCANGREALALLGSVEPRPSLVILDMNLPIMNGEEFLTELRKTSEGAETPVIAISAQKNRSPQGVCCFLAKPFSLDELLGGVQRCLARP